MTPATHRYIRYGAPYYYIYICVRVRVKCYFLHSHC